jgi:hypothetical protein
MARLVRYEADLVDQLFNSGENRLARILLLLSHFGKESRAERVAPGITQEHVAQMGMDSTFGELALSGVTIGVFHTAHEAVEWFNAAKMRHDPTERTGR